MSRLQGVLGPAQVQLAARAEQVSATGERASAGAERLSGSMARLQGSLQAASIAKDAAAEGARPWALVRRELGG
jgi:hypothetical protein